ncbi:MAG: PorT family protein [Chloroflexia bacterium]|nr:PorT family protein [Chloroflexia bacterium]
MVFIAIFATSYHANAQLGVKLGYNFAKQSGVVSDGYSEKSLNNVLFGAFMEKDVIPLLGIRIGAEFSPKGVKGENGDYFEELKINYLEIPVQAKVKLGPLYVLGGVYGAFALKGAL